MSTREPQTIYVDESNNSGENLIDPSQPTFTLAAISMDTAQAEAVIAEVKRKLPQGLREPKYGTLVRSGAGRRTLLAALQQLPDGAAYAYAVHKRYMVIAKMVDYLAVEIAREDGYDMYADGSAVGLANLIHMVGPVVGSADLYNHMLSTFVRAVRMKSSASVDELFDAIAAYRSTTGDDFGTYIGILEAARAHADDLVKAIATNGLRDSLDPAIPSLIVLCHKVSEAVGEFHLVHDQSKTIASNLGILQSLDQLPAVTPGLPPTALPVVSISFADSTNTPQLQIADWVAGATRQVADAMANDRSDPFAEQLDPLVQLWIVDTLFPNPDLITSPRRL